MADSGIYFAVKGSYPIGPYHPDEFRAQLRAQQMLSNRSAGPVYRIVATDLKDALAKARGIR